MTGTQCGRITTGLLSGTGTKRDSVSDLFKLKQDSLDLKQKFESLCMVHVTVLLFVIIEKIKCNEPGRQNVGRQNSGNRQSNAKLCLDPLQE